MDDIDVYEFRIGAYTPSTIPMSRLAEYMVQLAIILGEEERVHFNRLSEGSTRIACFVEQEAVPKVRENVQQLEAGISGPRSLAFERANEMLRKDNGEGTLSRGGAKILHFPGKHTVQQPVFGPITKPTSKDGILIKVGGKDKTAHATIEDLEGRTWNFEVTRSLAKDLAPHLFGKPIRLMGQGKWTRHEDGVWRHKSLKAINFEVLDDRTLADFVSHLRAASEGIWNSYGFTPADIMELRGSTEGAGDGNS